MFDAETIPLEEYLDQNDSKVFRSALGICLYLSQERLDIQQTTRVLSSYMGRPTKTAMCALKKLGSYLIQTQDMKMHYPQAEAFASTETRWHGVGERKDGRPWEIELYSDSDWASCKVTRRSTSSGLVFLNSCCVHSHSRAQMSVSLSSMEAEILAATSLLVEGIQLKQLLQFLLGDEGGLSNNAQVQMRLRLDSTSAQSFFNRLGPGRAKHLSTRLLWSQQAMRKRWFLVERISTKENPADLNTKPLSRERREYLMKKIGLMSETFNEENYAGGGVKVKQIVRLVVAMMTTGNLQGCDGPAWTWNTTWTSWMNPMSWTSTAWWTILTLMLVGLVSYLVNYINELKKQLAKYKTVWTSIRETMDLVDTQDPFVQELLPDARQDPFSGIWYQEADEEEETIEDDSTVVASIDQMVNAMEDVMNMEDREEVPQAPRVILRNGTHGASPEEHAEVGEESEPASGSRDQPGVAYDEIPTTEEGIAILTNAIAEIADGAATATHGGEPHSGHADESDDDWLEEDTETRSQRYLRYVQSSQCEVSDPDEWADVHYGPARSRSRSRDTPMTSPERPSPKAMPKILAERRRCRVADEVAEEMVRTAEEEQERRGTQPSPSAGSVPQTLPADDNVNYFRDSLTVANYFGVGMVPREYAAFEDYRWDLIMQGLGPETILVHNCRELSHYIAECGDLVERHRLQRLLRSLQALLVMLQSKDPNLWIDAAYNVRDWMEAGRSWNFFEEGSTAMGSRNEEGEEEERDDDDDIDPQDLRPLPDGGRDGSEPDEGPSSGTRPTSWDYDDGAVS